VIAREEYAGGRAFEVVIANLLAESTDAIVNAANGQLAHGGGVAAAIARAAGAALVQEGDRIVASRGPLAVGEAVVTSAGKLPFKGVIHAVGPQQGIGREEERLVQALGAAFRCAEERGFESLSFPAVSSGDLRGAARGVRARLRARRARVHERPPGRPPRDGAAVPGRRAARGARAAGAGEEGLMRGETLVVLAVALGSALGGVARATASRASSRARSARLSRGARWS
jgi:O-acetyl-ADP-ribose deacetylase (regulator of RNase III)